MKHSVGDKVMALWPGSGLYYHAEIKRIIGDRVDILYSDGTEMEISLKHVRTEEYFKPKRAKSPSRRRSRSPARSPGRKSRILQKGDSTPTRRKSRSASRGHSKKTSSPVRKFHSTSRGRVAESSPSSQSASSSDEKPALKKVTVNEVTIDSRYIITRQRAKAAAIKEDVSNISTKEPIEYEFGGVFGAFIMHFASPLGTLFLLLASIKADWSLSKFTKSMIPCTWDAYFSVKAFAIVEGFMLFHAMIYALPFGHIIKGSATVRGKHLEYRIGARYTLLFTMLAFATMLYYQVPLLQVHDELFQLAVAATIIAVIGNLMVYITSFWVPKEELNPNGNTGSFIYDSFIGRWLHPRIGKLFDLKLYLYRPCMAGWLVLIWIEMYKEYETSGGKHNTAFLLVATSQIVYIVMEFFFDEEQCPFMFDIKNESLGLVQFVGELVVVPFLYNLQVRYLADNPNQLTLPNSLIFCILTFSGFYIHVVSARQKNMFRKNPYDHRIAHYSSLPSSRPDGQRLLISGLWGVVRQPHYLGDILIGLSWSVLCVLCSLITCFKRNLQEKRSIIVVA